jgi:hypothetical protein
MVLAIIAVTTLTVGTCATAQTEKVLHNFAVGMYPNGGLIADAAGNFYGTTEATGSGCTGSGCGTVFE